MSKTIALDEAATCAVHDLLAGQSSDLSQILIESKQAMANGSVTWSIPVTSATVHKIVTICLFAADNGVSVELQSPRDLSDQESIFHEDFLLR